MDLKELERERRQLAKAGDATGLEELAGRAEQLPPSDRRDRLIYAARQNAAYARRGGSPREGNRGFAIGVVVLTVLLVGGVAALAAFGDFDTTYAGDYTIYNDEKQKIQVWTCTDDTCSLRDEAGSAEPGDEVRLPFAQEGDLVLISGKRGDVLGCITLSHVSEFEVEAILDSSDVDECPAGAPTSVG